MTIFISIKATKEHEEKLQRNLKQLQKRGYPKIGNKLKAIKSGNTFDNEFHVTKGKVYEVVDNIDLMNGYLHVKADDNGHVLLELNILEEFFGVTINV